MTRPVGGRPAPRGTSLVIVALLAVLTAVLLVIFVLRLSRSPRAKVQLGTQTLSVGPAGTLAQQIAKGGPVLLPPLRGSLILFVQHLGQDPAHGWLAFEAGRRDGGKVCPLQWRVGRHDFIDPCDGQTFPASGQGLEQYRATVDPKGKLTVDPRQPTGTIPRPS